MEQMTDYTDPIAEFMWPMDELTEETEESTPEEARVKKEEPSETSTGILHDTVGEPSLDDVPEQKESSLLYQTPVYISSGTQDQLSTSELDQSRRDGVEGARLSSDSSYSSHVTSSSASESGDEIPNGEDPLAYARYYGLCSNYQKADLLNNDLVPLPSKEEVNEVRDGPDFDGGADVRRQVLDERLDVDKDTVTYLSRVLSMGRHAGDDMSLDPHASKKKLKIDEPLLTTDHELEMLRLRRKTYVKLSSKGIAPFRLDRDKDEGLPFPSRRAAEKSAIEKEIRNAKLDVTSETVEYLKGIYGMLYKDPPNLADEAYRERKEYLGKTGHTTPPLIQLSSPRSAGQPASDAMMIETTSTPEDLLGRDMMQSRRHLEAEDEVGIALQSHQHPGQTQHANSGDDYLAEFLLGSSSSSPLERKRVRNLRLESPLLAHDYDESSAKRRKKVNIPSDLASLIPSPDAPDITNIDLSTSDEVNAFVEGVAMPIAEEVNTRVRREKLSEADATMRLKVPFVEELRTIPPWQHDDDETGKRREGRNVFSESFTGELLNRLRWSGVSRLENQISWRPFPSAYGKVDVNESFDDGSCRRYLDTLELEGEIDVDALIARTDGLKILEAHDSDDEDIAPPAAATEEVQNPDDDGMADDENNEVASALREDIPKPQQESDKIAIEDKRIDLLSMLRKRQEDLGLANPSQRHAGKDNVRTGRDESSAAAIGTRSSLLNNDDLGMFMQLHGRSSRQGAVAQVTARKVTHIVAPAAVMVPQAAVPVAPQPPEPPLQLAAPDIAVHTSAPLQVVLSTPCMAHRNMIRELQSVLPHAELLEREANDALAEADVTLSPSTGLMITTLQKLKQRPLPGQTGFVGVRERIAAVARRYERLLVLVSEGSSSVPGSLPVKGLSQRDSEEVIDLIGFTASIETTIEVTYVAGGEVELANWIASAITRYSSCNNGASTLLQDETMWERFLRRAGMNAYAAQSVMAELKMPDAKPPAGSSLDPSSSYTGPARYGLPAFVTMPADERWQRFGGDLGGGSVLTRVSDVMDNKWTGNNFRMVPR